MWFVNLRDTDVQETQVCGVSAGWEGAVGLPGDLELISVLGCSLQRGQDQPKAWVCHVHLKAPNLFMIYNKSLCMCVWYTGLNQDLTHARRVLWH